MTRLSAETLDLSRYPAPLAIRDYDYEAILSARMERFKALAANFGLAFDVDKLEADPAKILQRNDAYREMLAIARINDAVRSVMIAFAVGADLDHMAARFGVKRRVIEPATGSLPAIMESDEEFRRRALIAPEAFASAGPRGAYIYHALTSDPRVLNVDVWSPQEGKAVVAVQSRESDGVPDGDTVAAVRSYLMRDDIKPLTDMLSVVPVENFPFAISVVCYLRPGPDPVMVKADVEASLTRMVAARRTPARDVPLSSIYAAAMIGPVDRVSILAPTADIARGYGEVAACTSISVTMENHDG